MNRLIDRGAIQPVMSAVYPLDEVGEAARAVHRNEAEGKLGVLCLAPEAGQGVTDPGKRERIGEDRITLFQRHAQGRL
jgi:crotonyl-CoA reductase